jgi:uncharacterized membrane protein/plastocyanin
MSTSRTGSLLLSTIAAAAILSIFPAFGRAQSSVSEPVTIIIKQMRFNPPDKTVSPGAVVEWKNEDIFSHTVTADDGSFDSGLIAPGQSWKMTVKEAGTLHYHCGPHPNMAASLVVSSAAANAQRNGAPPAKGGENGPQSIGWAPPISPQQIHPILVNFTAALLPLAFLSDVLGRLFRRQSLHNAAWWMVLYAAAITPFTVLAGWWWKHAAGPDLPPKVITIHQWLGTSAALLFVVLAAWRWRIHKREIPPSIGYLILAFVAVLALVYQGSLGGTMVFGK